MPFPLILPLIGAGIGAAGALGGLAQRAAARGDIAARARGQNLIAQQAANRAAGQSIGLSQARATRNPNLALRNALLANQQLQANVAGAKAAEQARAQAQLAQMKRADADQLTKIALGAAGGLASAGSFLGAQQAGEAAQQAAGGHSQGQAQGGGLAAQAAGLFAAPPAPAPAAGDFPAGQIPQIPAHGQGSPGQLGGLDPRLLAMLFGGQMRGIG